MLELGGALVGLAIEHVRLQIADSALASHLFADFFRLGRPAGSPPLICHWSGALTPDEYEARRHRDLAGVMDALERAMDGHTVPVDFLSIAAPNPTPRSRSQLSDDLAAFHDQLLAASPNPHPTDIGYLGYSAGAWVTVGLALSLRASCAVATLGGAGMTDALVDGSPAALRRLHFASFVNHDDPLMNETYVFRNALEARGRRLPVYLGPGRHDWEDYLANGLAQQAFRLVLGQLLACN